MKIHKLLILLALTLSCMVAAGQSCVSKSGTAVIPADHLRAVPSSMRSKKMPLPDPTAGTYLVVVRPDMEDALQPLLQWKRCQGYRVETIVTHTANCDSVRHMLTQRYNQSSPLRPAQRYVLIVGDVDRIASFWGKHTPGGLRNHVTDLYYGEYTGDYLPEAWVGRLSVADNDQLAQVADKIVRYEQGQWAHAHRLLLAAGNEDRSPAPTTTNGQVNYLAQLAAQCRPELDTICYRNPQADSLFATLVSDIDNANALVNYTAHCTAAGWSDPYVSATTIDTLQAMQPTVFVNNCCLSNAFNSNCFGEALLRHPTAGAAAVIGASNESFWAEDYFWAVGAKYPITLLPAYDTTTPGALDAAMQGHAYNPDPLSLGAINYAGCSAVTWAGSPLDAFYWEIYTLLGDPSMTLYWGHADTLTLATDSILYAGTPSVEVTTSPLARVSATCDSTLLATTLADGQGHAVLQLESAPTSDHITLTATRPEAIYCQQSVRIVPPDQARLAVTDARIANNTLSLTIANVGQQDALTHTLNITQQAHDWALGAQLPASGFDPRVLTLAPGQQTTVDYPLSTCLLGAEPLLAVSIVLADAHDSVYATWPLRLAMDDHRPTLAQLQLQEADGTPARVIYHNHAYRIATQMSRMCDSITIKVNNTPIGNATQDSLLAANYHTPDSLDRILMEIDCHRGNWHRTWSQWMLPYHATEDFETGTLGHYPWQHTNTYPWAIDTTHVRSGHYCLRSAAIDHAQKSTITLDIETLADDTLSFYYQVSSEAHDWLNFYVDGRRRGYWSGNQGWNRFAYLLPAGKHRLEWEYQKDASGQELDDCARIDDICLPLSIWDRPCGHSVRQEEPLTGIAEEETYSARIYAAPNPVRDATTIHTKPTQYERTATLYDIQGRAVDQIKIASNAAATQYSTAHLRLGIYTLALHDQCGVQICKIIVTR